jgi:hypothetical protein
LTPCLQKSPLAQTEAADHWRDTGPVELGGILAVAQDSHLPLQAADHSPLLTLLWTAVAGPLFHAPLPALGEEWTSWAWPLVVLPKRQRKKESKQERKNGFENKRMVLRNSNEYRQCIRMSGCSIRERHSDAKMVTGD